MRRTDNTKIAIPCHGCAKIAGVPDKLCTAIFVLRDVDVVRDRLRVKFFHSVFEWTNVSVYDARCVYLTHVWCLLNDLKQPEMFIDDVRVREIVNVLHKINVIMMNTVESGSESKAGWVNRLASQFYRKYRHFVKSITVQCIDYGTLQGARHRKIASIFSWIAFNGVGNKEKNYQ